MSEPVTSIEQADYMKLFMQELTYQDPLKPLDNREFMAQMAQISALQQAQLTQEATQNILATSNANQALMLLGKHVEIKGGFSSGTVERVVFNNNEPLKLEILTSDGRIKAELREIASVQ